MSETARYKLHLTDDSNERFLDWREAMNGTGNSNMVKIDRALGEKADSSVDIDAVLLADAWEGESAPFTQALSIDGLTDQNGTISVSHTAVLEQREAARCAVMSVAGQGDGKLIIVADGRKPAVDIPVTVIMIG